MRAWPITSSGIVGSSSQVTIVGLQRFGRPDRFLHRPFHVGVGHQRKTFRRNGCASPLRAHVRCQIRSARLHLDGPKPSCRFSSVWLSSASTGSRGRCRRHNRAREDRSQTNIPDSKSGRMTHHPQCPFPCGAESNELIGPYVVPGDDPEERPRTDDLKRPWDAVTKYAGLPGGLRLHDLRHTYASFGAGGGLGLPIIGRLFGHAQTGDYCALCASR